VWDADTAGKQNYHRDSEDLEAWTSVNMTVSNAAATITLANGQQVELALLTGDATVDEHYIVENNHFGDGAPDPSLFPVRRRNSVYVKAGTARYVVVSDRVINGAGGTQYQSIFDFQTEAWVYTGTFYTQHGFESLGNGAYRLWFNDATTSTAYGESAVGVTSGATVFDSIYDATGETVYAGGWQIEFIAADEADGPTYYAKTEGKASDATDPTIIRQRVRSTTAWTSSSKTNYIDGTHDFTNAEWTGPAAVDYRTLTDSNAAAYHSVLQKHTVYAGEDAVVQARVSKDNVAKTTRFPILRLEFRTEAASSCDVALDTSTGEVVLANNSNATVHGYGVIDEGRYWRIWISANDNGRGNSQVWPSLFPAVGAGTLMTSADYSVTGQGTITVDGVNCTFDKVTQNSELPPMIRSDQDVPNVGYYDTNVVYLYKGAVQPTKLDLTRDFSVGSDEWFAWRRRRRDQVRAAQWSNPKGPIY
jgi:hypothetical protein